MPGTSRRAAWQRRSQRGRGIISADAASGPRPGCHCRGRFGFRAPGSYGRGRRDWPRLWPAPCHPGIRIEQPARAERYAAVLFCIGSHHEVTTAQQRELAAVRPVVVVNAEAGEAPRTPLQEPFAGGAHVVLQVPCGRIAPERIRESIGDWRGPLVLSGGATAALVCRALGVRAIWLQREIAPGIPRGVISGGLFDGSPVVTKSGGFGIPSALIQIADELICP